MRQTNKTKLALSISLLVAGMTATPIQTAPHTQSVVSYFDSSWSVIANDEEGPTPGVGGQVFDTEYLLYKTEGNMLYLGLQSGFDLIDGHQTYDSNSYWAGDLALSFDGDANIGSADPITMANSYEFGIDFGFSTADYDSNSVDAIMNSVDGLGPGVDQTGIYSVGSGEWNTNLVNSFEDNSSPFAMDQLWDGNGASPYLTSLILNTAGLEGDSYYRAVEIDMTKLGLADLGLNLNNLSMDVHWTMSCGNDNINGSQQISVPEPDALILLATGLLGLVGARRVKREA